MCLHGFVEIPVGQRFHSSGNLQHTIETHHRPESPVKAENELVEITLQVRRTDSMMSSKEPRIQIPKYDVDHWEMLIRLGLITSDGHGCMPVAQLVQVIIASPPVGSYFRFRLYVGKNHRFQRLLLAVWDNLKA